ncbi:MAG: universal stress protein [Dehalococcoidia bacterium]
MPIKILVTLDGSAFSEQILETAVRMAGRTQAEVSLLRVVPPARGSASRALTYDRRVDERALGFVGDERPEVQVGEVETVDQAAESLAADAMAYLAPLRHRFEGDGESVQCLVREGEHAEEQILRCAEELGVDMIAMATHGRGGLAHLLTGSVVDKVMRAGMFPVLLYRPA